MMRPLSVLRALGWLKAHTCRQPRYIHILYVLVCMDISLFLLYSECRYGATAAFASVRQSVPLLALNVEDTCPALFSFSLAFYATIASSLENADAEHTGNFFLSARQDRQFCWQDHTISKESNHVSGTRQVSSVEDSGKG